MSLVYRNTMSTKLWKHKFVDRRRMDLRHKSYRSFYYDTCLELARINQERATC